MFYDTFVKLCEEKRLTPTEVIKDLGMSSATVTRWKQGTSSPNMNTLYMISDYFQVPVCLLFGMMDAQGQIKYCPFQNDNTDMAKRHAIFEMLVTAEGEDLDKIYRISQIILETEN